MSRRYVGNWADSAQPELRPLAIVALGVLVAELWPSQEGGGEPEEVAASGPDRVAEALAGALRDLARIYSPIRLRWGHDDQKRWEVFKKCFSPELVADGWRRFIKMFGEVDLETWDSLSGTDLNSETWTWLTQFTWDTNAGVRSIFIKCWRGDRDTWHWPVRVGFLGDPNSRSLLEDFHRSDRGWLHRLAHSVDVEKTGFSCDLLLSPLDASETRKALAQARSQATAIALIGNRPFDTGQDALSSLELIETANASAIAFLPTEKISLDIVVELIRQISHNHSFDVAVHLASRDLKSGPPLVCARERFIRNSPISRLASRWADSLDRRDSMDAQHMRFLASSSYLSEAGAANELVEFAKKTDVRRASPRYLRANAWQFRETHISGDERVVHLHDVPIPANTLVAERWQILGVRISPEPEKVSVEMPPFPDDQVAWDGGPQIITMAVTAPDCSVVALPLSFDINEAGEMRFLRPELIELPSVEKESSGTASAEIHAYPSGPSQFATFLVAPHRTGQIKMRVMTMHANRILQTAILHAEVLTASQTRAEPEHTGEGPTIRLVPEGALRSSLQDLEDRRVFDLAILTNDSLTGGRQITAVTDDNVLLKDFGSLEKVVERVAERVRKLVDEPEAFNTSASGPATDVLKKLAHEGVLIRDGLEACGLGPILRRDPLRIQIVSARPDDILPLEFIYEGPAPDPTTASACPKQADALEHGSCRDCPNRESDQHVCAMRFWGLGKVIERHLYDPDSAPTLDTLTTLAPSAELEHIAYPEHRIFACSVRAEKFPNGSATIDRLKSRLGVSPDLARDHSSVDTVNTWQSWRDCVQNHAPTLMVLLPHTDKGEYGEELHIGEAEILTSAQINSTIVGTKAPVIVVLLGCETASAQVRYASFAARFRTAKAAVVIGTLTLVLGRHAASVAETFVNELERYWRDRFRTATIGDVITDIRRRLMQRGLPIGLTIVAFGDADWLVGG